MAGSAANAADVPDHTTCPFSMIASRSASFTSAARCLSTSRMAWPSAFKRARQLRRRGSVVDAEPTVPRARHQPRELRLADVNERRVIAAFEINVGLLLDAVVDDDVEIVAFADGGNRTELAVRKQPLDLAFVGQSDVIADLLPQIRQADVVRRWQHRPPVAAVAEQLDGLGKAIAGDVAGLGGARGRHRGVVRDHLVGDVLVEMLLQCRGERHGYPPSMEMRWAGSHA